MTTVNKIRLFFLALCVSGLTIATATAQDYKIIGNEIVKIETVKEKPVKTEFTHTVNGVKYPVYKSVKGAYYILRLSKKTGRQYKQYLKIE